jgi:hypothetical protein
MKRFIIWSILLFVASGVQASVYDVMWNGGTGLWMTESNWTEDTSDGSAWAIPGWVGGNPYNDKTWSSTSNKGYAWVKSGTAQITSSSYPDGRIERLYLGGESGANMTMTGGSLTVYRIYLADGSGNIGTFTQSGGTTSLTAASNYFGNSGTATYSISGGTLNTGSGTVNFGNSTGGAGTLNISGSGRVTGSSDYYLGYATNASGTMNITGGSINDTSGTATSSIALHVGYAAGSAGTVVQSDGDVKIKILKMGENSASSGTYTISGGSLEIGRYISVYYNSTFKVSGSDAASILIKQLAMYRDSTVLAVELDAEGSTLIEIYGTASDTYSGANLANATLQIDTLSDFDGVVGDVYDILWSATTISATNLVFSNLSSTQFSWAVMDDTVRGGQVLQVTVIPEPASMVLLSFGCLLFVRHKK